jgi:hypothetical protein
LYKITQECEENDPYIASKLDLRDEFVNKLVAVLSKFNIHFQPMPNANIDTHYLRKSLEISQAA